jgi:cytochrome oxidase Cu insertion factor (SCO1/SenC/PrrC family)
LKLRVINLAFLLLAVGQPLFAGTTPAPRNDALPDIIVQTDDGATPHLRELLRSMGDGPVLLLPLFTRCSASCPTLLHKLEESLAVYPPSTRVRVLVFSFDPGETQASLSAFRKASAVPADWQLARANEGVTRELLQSFNYPVMSQGAVLIHPSEVFVFDNALRWRWTIDGVTWTPKDLAHVIERTSSSGFISRIEDDPQGIAWLGFAFALGSVCLAIGFWTFRATFSELWSWHRS